MTQYVLVRIVRTCTVSSKPRHFRLSYYPHRVDDFGRLLRDSFGAAAADHAVFGDFRPRGELADPAFYIHVVQKPLEGGDDDDKSGE